MTPRPIAVAALVREAYDGAKVIAAKQGVKFSTSVEPGLPLIVGDEAKLLQVLSNLVGNALKFTPAGRSVKIFAGGVVDGMVTVGVADTGVGIPKADIPHLFEKFKTFRLAISRHITNIDTGEAKLEITEVSPLNTEGN